MKKLLGIFLSLFLILALASCHTPVENDHFERLSNGDYIDILLYDAEDKVAEDGFYDFVQSITFDLLTMFQTKIGGKAFVIEILAYLEGFSDTGMTYVHGIPPYLAIGAVVIDTEVGIEVFVVAVYYGF